MEFFVTITFSAAYEKRIEYSFLYDGEEIKNKTMAIYSYNGMSWPMVTKSKDAAMINIILHAYEDKLTKSASIQTEPGQSPIFLPELQGKTLEFILKFLGKIRTAGPLGVAYLSMPPLREIASLDDLIKYGYATHKSWQEDDS